MPHAQSRSRLTAWTNAVSMRAAQLRWAADAACASRLRVDPRTAPSHRGKRRISRGCRRGGERSPAGREARLRSPAAGRCLPLAGAKCGAGARAAAPWQAAAARFGCTGIDFEVQRQPFGTVLVIGPGNYPLFLPAVHALHALVAGNAVLLKPAPGTRRRRARLRPPRLRRRP